MLAYRPPDLEETTARCYIYPSIGLSGGWVERRDGWEQVLIIAGTEASLVAVRAFAGFIISFDD
jgi:hypothetical protein